MLYEVDRAETNCRDTPAIKVKIIPRNSTTDTDTPIVIALSGCAGAAGLKITVATEWADTYCGLLGLHCLIQQHCYKSESICLEKLGKRYHCNYIRCNRNRKYLTAQQAWKRRRVLVNFQCVCWASAAEKRVFNKETVKWLTKRQAKTVTTRTVCSVDTRLGGYTAIMFMRSAVTYLMPKQQVQASSKAVPKISFENKCISFADQGCFFSLFSRGGVRLAFCRGLDIFEGGGRNFSSFVCWEQSPSNTWDILGYPVPHLRHPDAYL